MAENQQLIEIPVVMSPELAAKENPTEGRTIDDEWVLLGSSKCQKGDYKRQVTPTASTGLTPTISAVNNKSTTTLMHQSASTNMLTFRKEQPCLKCDRVQRELSESKVALARALSLSNMLIEQLMTHNSKKKRKPGNSNDAQPNQQNEPTKSKPTTTKVLQNNH